MVVTLAKSIVKPYDKRGTQCRAIKEIVNIRALIGSCEQIQQSPQVDVPQVISCEKAVVVIFPHNLCHL
jgi:hypothetical protein